MGSTLKRTSIINVKILSLGDPERYTVRRLVLAAEQELLASIPDFKLNIIEVKEAEGIGRYSQVLVLPTLVINEKVACSGRFPSRQEVLGWLKESGQSE
jgi:hypothetical protein